MGGYFKRVDKGRTVCGGFYNGRIDSPRVANRVLSPAEMELAKTRPTHGSLATAVIGAWDFSQGITTTTATDLIRQRPCTAALSTCRRAPSPAGAGTAAR